MVMELKKAIYLFLAWRFWLFVVLFLAIPILPLQFDFLGGRFTNYLLNPQLWSLANFDGVRYLAIADEGYRPFTYFYFPLYPILLSVFATLINTVLRTGNYIVSFLYSGLVVTSVSFVIGL